MDRPGTDVASAKISTIVFLRYLPPRIALPLGRITSRSINAGRGIRWAISPDVQAHHTETSILVNALEEIRVGSGDRLLDLVLRSAQRAKDLELDHVASRQPQFARMVNLWPGEHYRFLAALVAEMEPQTVVEVGTFRGMGALALRAGKSASCRIITFDVVPWRTFHDTLLLDEDFDETFEQRVGDLSDVEFFQRSLPDLDGALIFIDATKSVRLQFERSFVRLLRQHLRKPTILVFDDIRLLTMVEFWRSLDLPKFDATSLGHWTGTGLVELVPSISTS